MLGVHLKSTTGVTKGGDFLGNMVKYYPKYHNPKTSQKHEKK